MKRANIIIALLLFTFGCVDAGLKTMQKTGSVMGTHATITVVVKDEEKANFAIDAAMAELKRLDAMLSLYSNTSEVFQVNRAAGKRPVKVSSEMIEVVETAAWISELTGGAFDVTIGPLVVLWQMRLKEKKTPGDAEIAAISRRVGYKDIVIDKKASTLFLKHAGMILDFGGLAKGYAADKAAAVLRKHGIENGIVALAGDIRVMGKRTDKSLWRIGVQHPRKRDKILTVLGLSDKFVSTSGDYERFQIMNKKRYHHILDPRTGRPSEGMMFVTVVGDNGAIVDPLTTALFVLGAEKGMELVKKLGYEAIFEDDTGRIVMTEGIKAMQTRLYQ